MNDIFAWTVIIILLVLVVYFAIKFLKTKLFYFSKMDSSQVFTKDVKIPIGDIELSGKLIFPKFVLDENNRPKEKLPLIFFNHGWSAGIDISMTWAPAYAIAIGGPYAVLLYDCRGHGNSPGKRIFSEQIFDDIPEVFDFGEKLEDIDPNRLGFIGFSFGGEVALSRAYPDKRIKAVVACCTPHNAKVNFSRKPATFKDRMMLSMLKARGVNYKKITDEMNLRISPEFVINGSKTDLNSRVLLVHAKNDKTISFIECEKNRKALNSPEENVLFFENGGHAMFHQELSIVASALRFFKEKL